MTKSATASVVPFALSVLAMGAVGTAAHADGVETRSVDLTVELRVAERCGFNGSAAATRIADGFRGLRPGQARSVEMALDCNVPFRIQARSTSGGLVPVGASQDNLDAAARDGFTLRLPYSVALDVPLLPINSSGLTAENIFCESSVSMTLATARSERCVLARNRGALFGGLTGAGASTLTLTLSAITGTPIAGDYSDTLTINIEPAT